MRWGSDGLAFYNAAGQVMILRGLLVPTNPPADIMLSQSIGGLTATTNDKVNVSLLLTNAGGAAASQVVVTQTFSLPVTNVTLISGSGTASYSNSIVVWQPGSLAAGAFATLNVGLFATKSGTLTVSASAYHELNDPGVQRARSQQDLQKRQHLGRETVSLDEDFFQALEAGMPPSAGIALRQPRWRRCGSAWR